MSEEKGIVDFLNNCLEELALNLQDDENPLDINKQVNTTPTSSDRMEARTIVVSVRGVPVGRYVDFKNEKNVRDVTGADKSNLSLILKNDLEELVYVTKVDDMLVYTSISKKRLIKRETILIQRAVQFLKRFLVQS